MELLINGLRNGIKRFRPIADLYHSFCHCVAIERDCLRIPFTRRPHLAPPLFRSGAIFLSPEACLPCPTSGNARAWSPMGLHFGEVAAYWRPNLSLLPTSALMI